MNLIVAKKIISNLQNQYGVNTFCVCSGSRNIPFIYILSKTKNIQIFPFFDERSAGFFALGRIRRTEHPVVVVTTSGTAVAELLPSVIEAYYSELPLILLTADRPSPLRASGAPQTIWQVGIFSHYVEHTIDLENTLNFKLPKWSMQKPFHINVCFDEPLLNKTFDKKPTNFLLTKNKSVKAIRSFLSISRKPLIILSEIPKAFRAKTATILSNAKLPIYAEALSGLRESQFLSPLTLKSGDTKLNKWVKDQKIDGVVRIGRLPCTRFWMHLEKAFSYLPVLSISDQIYSGLSRQPALVSFKDFFKYKKLFKTIKHPQLKQLLKEDAKENKTLHRLLKKYPLSELGFIQYLSKNIPKKSLIFLGNSLPIREWNLTATYQNQQFDYIGNRGVNGIDGLLSSFLGASKVSHSNWCILGDLSTLYDLSAPWILKHLPKKGKYFIVIINNQGGKIFSKLPDLKTLPNKASQIINNPHTITFKHLAKLWEMHYYLLKARPKTFNFQSPAIIEIRIHHQQTQKLVKAFKNL